jgi:transcriptional regulator, Spx/MgsR family
MQTNPQLTLYAYRNCDTCRKARRFLQERDIPFTEVPIREQPPGPAELRQMLHAYGGERRKLFNTSGRDYRESGIKEKLASLSESEVIDCLAANGNLIKRPFLIGPSVARVGFKEAEWEAALS